MKRITLLALLGAAFGLTACTDRSESILDACGPGGHVVAIDDDQIVCEPGFKKQYVRQADDDS